MAQVPTAGKSKIEDTANDVADRVEKKASTSSGATSGDVQAEVENLRRDLASLAQTVASFGSGKIRQAGKSASQMTSGMAESSSDYMASARESIANVEQDLEAHVRARPIQSIAIAAAVGYMAAVLNRR
ncbi:DUF883 family protein [Peteryoungia desertarenae]|uniref:DUF883 family protein n=1 Tax=Peteryoungia desertarenae TaxID=1813451 RepID=A0ABX6QIJ8_9HYPH|nr:DUF883 family protein [Peteryoungia desertarenae]QLF68384.1 DUF883 family protein [Peteryoungia desertarenae]